MDKRISATLDKVRSDTQKASSPNTSMDNVAPLLGKPDCPYCGGVGFLRVDVPVGHQKFGRLEPCVCRANEIAENARQRLYEMSNLERLSHLTFANFNSSGNPKAEFVSPQEVASLRDALDASEHFAKTLTGWLLLEGSYGCGKTHLAAAIANECVQRGVPTLFITVPDLLDSLRFAYADPETTFEERFETIRTADLLVMDDFGTQNATPWAQEKLFQIINARYINKLPTVITTNLILDEVESRIRSRLQDAEFVKYIRITAPDFRRPTETSNPGISMLSLSHIKDLSFGNFETRDDEVGKEIVTTITKERQDRYGRPVKDKEIVREKVTVQHIKRLHEALDAAVHFAEGPNGWLVILGGSHSGKTHLAAAVGNYRLLLGGQAILAEVSTLLDYLKATFRPNSDVTFDRRSYEIRTTPLLMLDDLKESGISSVWAEDKLHQILNHRYYASLPTVITSTLDPESFAKSYPSLWNKLLDTSKCQICVIDMPPYRKSAKGKKAAAKKK
ncbi:MAG TPA: ATP-binding protein [Anaerolineales bacterium]|nr:ATP-binding protein [Anaerolineales bacterium]HNS62645.1 ATP-binding protein [Anaerolineales bacterium]